MRTFEWAIEDIIAAYPALGLDESAAAAVALMQDSGRPCDFYVLIDGFELDDLDGERQFVVSLTWNAETATRAKQILRTKQRATVVENAAIAIAFLLMSHLISESQLLIAIRGEGPDYWLSRLHLALEISGTERFQEMTRRLREKREQLLGNWRGWDGYVVLCCFARSRRAIQWSYHSQPG